MHQQTGRVVAELRVVRGEPGGEHRAGGRPEVCGDRPVTGVHHGQHSGEVLFADLEEVVDQVDDPGPREPVHAAGPAVLGGLPAHERAQDPRVALVVDEPHLAHVAPEAALLLQRRLGQAGVGAAQPLRVALLADLQVEHGRGEGARHVVAERPLLLDEVVELEDRQAAGAQQFAGVPGDAGAVHEGLAVGEAEPDGPADTEGVAFERQEADGLTALAQDREPRPAAMPGDPHRELRREEGVGVLGRRVHRPVPGTAQCRAQLVEPLDRCVHLRSTALPRAPRGTCPWASWLSWT